MKKRILAGLVIAGFGVISNALPSFAGTTPGILTINASVLGTCVVTPAVLSFGSLSAGNTTSLDRETNIDVLCSNGIDPSSISLTAPAGGRKLTAVTGGSTVDYQLYTTTARDTIWDTTNTVNPDAATVIPGALKVNGNALKVYGRIGNVPGGALVDAYVGTETITVTY